MELRDTSNGNALVATGTLSGGSASITVPAGALSVGTHNLVAASIEGAPTTEIVSALLSSNSWRESGVAPPTEGGGMAGIMDSLQESVDHSTGRIWGLEIEEVESLRSS